MKILLNKISKSEKDTIKIGNEIGNIIPKDINLIILKGDLASGKTTLIRGLVKSFGIKEDITSPTFNYKNDYGKVVHYDLYLLNQKLKFKKMVPLIEEELEYKKVIIEWGNKFLKMKNFALIKISVFNNAERKIQLILKK